MQGRRSKAFTKGRFHVIALCFYCGSSETVKFRDGVQQNVLHFSAIYHDQMAV